LDIFSPRPGDSDVTSQVDRHRSINRRRPQIDVSSHQELVQRGIGPVAVRQPRVRNREAGTDDPARIVNGRRPLLAHPR
jgi:hypothetical protein